MKLAAIIAIVSGVLFICSIFGWIAFPWIVKSKIRSEMTLKPKSSLRERYVKIPFPLTFKIYIFNVTNYLEVSKGERPVLEEIGPFVFDEWKEKVNLKDNETEDTLTYTTKDTWFFNKKLSGNLTGEEKVVVPHPLIIGTIMKSNEKTMVDLMSKAIHDLFNNPQSIFINIRAMDLLFDGITINCPSKSSNQSEALLVCSALSFQPDMKKMSDTIFKYSIFGMRNGTATKRFKVNRGIKENSNLGEILEYENKTKMNVWSGECNLLKGTDSTIFPPYLKKEDGLLTFAPDICRSIKAVFDRETYYDGIPCKKYVGSLGDISSDPALRCYCPSTTNCPKKGLMDIQPCTETPIIASLPHFHTADESYANNVEGLHPNEKDHGIVIYFETKTATVLSARKRFQFNFPISSIAQLECMNSLPNITLPFIWIDEGMDLNSTYTNQLKTKVFYILDAVRIIKSIVLAIALLGFIVAGYLHYRGSIKTETIDLKKVNPTAAPEEDSSVKTIHQT